MAPVCLQAAYPLTHSSGAWQEFVANGQGGLDELLAALDGGFEARPIPYVASPKLEATSPKPLGLKPLAR